MRTVRVVPLCAFLLSALLLPVVASAYTTPGTGVNWSAEDLVTNSGGIVTYDDANQRYVSTEPITVAGVDTLRIFSDFQVEATGVDDDFVANGYLYVGDPDGASTDSVVISGEATDGAGGFLVEDEPLAHLILTRVILIGGGDSGVDYGVRTFGGEALLEGCRISNWSGYAAQAFGGSLTIRHTLFHDNRDYTLSANNNSLLTLVADTLVRNNLAAPTVGKTAISLGLQGENHATIDSCYISGLDENRSGGISLWSAGSLQQATITHTTVQGCAFGINIQNTNCVAEISDCELLDNIAYSDPQVSGSGISVYPGGTMIVSHTEISGNWWGITLPGFGTGGPCDVTLGLPEPSTYFEEGHNRIHDNGNNDATWALYINDTSDVMAVNNYWGSTDSTEIAGWIFDHDDDETKGQVTWVPFWDGVEGPQPPVIVHAEPDSDAVNVWDYWFCRFSVTAVDPDGDDAALQYQWIVQGNDWGTDTTIVGNFLGDGTIPVDLTVTDEQGETVTRHWSVILHGPSDLMAITSTNPDSEDVDILTGASIDFSAEANSPSGEPLLHGYWLDNDNHSQEATWSHTFDTDGEYTVYCTIQDTVGNPWPAVGTQWTVHVTTDDVGESPALPAEFSLAAYPNPFNAELRMSYALPHDAEVTVTLFDVLGRQVQSLNLGQTGAGNHRLAVNASDLASGIYFIRFQAGEWSTVRKATLLR